MLRERESGDTCRERRSSATWCGWHLRRRWYSWKMAEQAAWASPRVVAGMETPWAGGGGGCRKARRRARRRRPSRGSLPTGSRCCGGKAPWGPPVQAAHQWRGCFTSPPAMHPHPARAPPTATAWVRDLRLVRGECCRLRAERMPRTHPTAPARSIRHAPHRLRNERGRHRHAYKEQPLPRPARPAGRAAVAKTRAGPGALASGQDARCRHPGPLSPPHMLSSPHALPTKTKTRRVRRPLPTRTERDGQAASSLIPL